MSWFEKSDIYSRTSSRTSSASTDTSSRADNEELNLTLYGESVPLRRTRTIIHRAKGRTLRTLSLVPGTGGGAAKLLAENTTLDLGFTMRTEEIDSFTNPYKPIGETSSSNRTSTYFSRRESDSSDIVESEQSDACTSKECSSIESSPAMTPMDNPENNLTRSSTCNSWTTDEYSVKSDHGSTSKNLEDYDSSGEWNNFWKKYNNTLNLKSVCTDIIPSLPIDDPRSCVSSRRSSYLDSASQKKVAEKKSPQLQKVIMSTADAIEAASCARRLSEILSSAIRRSSLPCTNKDANERNLLKLTKNIEQSIPQPPPLPLNEKIIRSKSEPELSNVTNITSEELQNKKLSLKPLLNDDCVEVEIQSTDPLNIAEILKKVLNQRRDIIMPQEDSPSGCQSHRSDWSSFDDK